jgi:nucleoside-diphosphate-sugar epimerase
MNVLVCGARGFIGSAITKALIQAGHTVVLGVSQKISSASIQIDYVNDTDVATWLPRLAGVDAVVNAIGVLRDTAKRPMQQIHTDTPIVLFDACAAAGVRRVIQISALGIADSSTQYARSKCAADAHLLSLNQQGLLNGVILRPSMVFGRGGDSSTLFINLAKLPLLVLPRAVIETRVQPVSVHELSEVVARLAGSDLSGMIECVGPAALKMGDFIGSLREQTGKKAAPSFALPHWLTQLSAMAGDKIPASPWCSEALALLASDNISQANEYRSILGRVPTHYSGLLALDK